MVHRAVWVVFWGSAAIFLGVTSRYYTSMIDTTSVSFDGPAQPKGKVEAESLVASVFNDAAACNFDQERRDFVLGSIFRLIDAQYVLCAPDVFDNTRCPFRTNAADTLLEYRQLVSEALLLRFGNRQIDTNWVDAGNVPDVPFYEDWNVENMWKAGNENLKEATVPKKCANGGKRCKCSADPTLSFDLGGLSSGNILFVFPNRRWDGEEAVRHLTYFELEFIESFVATGGDYHTAGDGQARDIFTEVDADGVTCQFSDAYLGDDANWVGKEEQRALARDPSQYQCFCHNKDSFEPLITTIHEAAFGKKPRGKLTAMPLIKAAVDKDEQIVDTLNAQITDPKRRWKKTLEELATPNGASGVEDSVQIFYNLFTGRYETSLENANGAEILLYVAAAAAAILAALHLVRHDTFEQHSLYKACQIAALVIVWLALAQAVTHLAASVAITKGNWGTYGTEAVLTTAAIVVFIAAMGYIHYTLRAALDVSNRSAIAAAIALPLLIAAAQVALFVYFLVETEHIDGKEHCSAQNTIDILAIAAFGAFVTGALGNAAVLAHEEYTTQGAGIKDRKSVLAACHILEYGGLALFITLIIGSTFSYPTCPSVAAAHTNHDAIFVPGTVLALQIAAMAAVLYFAEVRDSNAMFIHRHVPIKQRPSKGDYFTDNPY